LLPACAERYSVLPILLGKTKESVRDYTLHQTISLALANRKGDWKYLDHKGSGGNRYDRGKLKGMDLPDKAPGAPGQLYNLAADPGETNNLYFKKPEVVKELKGKLEQFKSSGRSAPERG
jgi:arylsulfatase A